MNLSARLVMLGLYSERGQAEAAAHVDAGIRGMLDGLRSQGMTLNFMPLTYGALDFAAGRVDSLADGLRESIALGLRWPPGNMAWFLSRLVGDAEVARLEAMMAEALEGERQRYAAERAAQPSVSR